MNSSSSAVLSRRTPKVTCGGCGAKYGDDAWSGLTLSQRIEAVEVRRHVLDWPDGLAVEVRVCTKCAALIARKQ
jgi:hypothetical protein